MDESSIGQQRMANIITRSTAKGSLYEVAVEGSRGTRVETYIMLI